MLSLKSRLTHGIDTERKSGRQAGGGKSDIARYRTIDDDMKKELVGLLE